MGLMQSFDSLGRIVGPVIGGAIYELHMDYTFALGAGLLFATTLMVRPRLRRYAHSSAAESSAGTLKQPGVTSVHHRSLQVNSGISDGAVSVIPLKNSSLSKASEC